MYLEIIMQNMTGGFSVSSSLGWDGNCSTSDLKMVAYKFVMNMGGHQNGKKMGSLETFFLFLVSSFDH